MVINVVSGTHDNVQTTITTTIKMTTDEDKSRLIKLLQDLEIPEVRLPERCQGLIKDWHEKFDSVLEEGVEVIEKYENPYIPDKDLLEETERKLRELLTEEKLSKKKLKEDAPQSVDPNKPWRTNSTKEKLLRIDGDLKRHFEKSADLIGPMDDGDMKLLVNTCKEEAENSAPVGADRLRETVEEARKCLPNFQYRSIENSTATAILPEAHDRNVDVINHENIKE